MRRRPLLQAALSGATLLARPTRAQTTRTIQVGVTRLTSDIPLFLADTRGYFKAESLAVELIPFVSGAKMVASLGSGELDVGAGATSVALFNAAARGLGIKVVADKSVISPGYAYKALMVRSDLAPKFKTLADLRGMKVAVVALGAADESVLHQALLKGGLKDEDVERVYLGFSQHLPAFTNRAIDAAIAAEPDVTQMLRTGVAIRFSGIDAFYPTQQVAVLLYGGAFAKEHALGLKFMRAYLRGVRDYVSTLHDGKIAGPGAAEMIAALLTMTGIKDPTILRDAVPPSMNPNGAMNLASLQTDLDYFKSHGQVAAGVQLSAVLDESFQREAAASLPPFP